MQIATNCILVDRALGTIGAVITMPDNNLAERLTIALQGGEPTVILEAHQRAELFAFDNNIPDEAVLARHRARIE